MSSKGILPFLTPCCLHFLILWYRPRFHAHKLIVGRLWHTHKQEMELLICVCTSFDFCQSFIDHRRCNNYPICTMYHASCMSLCLKMLCFLHRCACTMPHTAFPWHKILFLVVDIISGLVSVLLGITWYILQHCMSSFKGHIYCESHLYFWAHLHFWGLLQFSFLVASILGNHTNWASIRQPQHKRLNEVASMSLRE